MKLSSPSTYFGIIENNRAFIDVDSGRTPQPPAVSNGDNGNWSTNLKTMIRFCEMRVYRLQHYVKYVFLASFYLSGEDNLWQLRNLLSSKYFHAIPAQYLQWVNIVLLFIRMF